MEEKSLYFIVVFHVLLSVYAASPVSNCLDSISAEYKLINLPGTGWDNLLNENRGKVIHYEYSKCQTTDDGLYLIPDNLFVLPRKSSNVDIFSEIFDHWSNYSSTTSKSINVGGSIGIPWIFSIHGTYSSEYQQVKTQQVGDNSLTVRVGARYEKYIARLQNEFSLDDTFKDQVSRIAEHLASERKHSAKYESQLLIRDFGTHLITEISVGAAIYKLEQLNRTSIRTGDLTRSDIAKSAGFSFFGSGIDFHHDSSSSDTKLTSYLGLRTHSSVKSHGGPMFKPVNFSINEWVDSIGNDTVAIDRSGDPLSLVVNINNFPDLPESLVKQTASLIEETIVTYYKYNTIKGCTNVNSPNFNFLANVDDGTCNDSGANLTFGGIYQTCNYEGDLSKSLCDDQTIVNPKTGSQTCPEGYDSVPLFVGNISKTEVTQDCEGYMIFWKKCQDVPYFGSATYQTFWCAAVKNNVPDDSGYLFGGLFTPTSLNLLTNSPGCPQSFRPIRIATDINICVSDDFSNGEKSSLPFGGFFSCQQGNPLASTYYTPGPTSKTCPEGYSQHIAAIEEGCEISYCTKMRSSISPIRVKSPPFIRPRIERNDNSSFIVDIDGKSWTNIFSVPENFSGFSWLVPGWITYDGKKLNVSELLIERQQYFNKPKPQMSRATKALNQECYKQRTMNTHKVGKLDKSVFQIALLSVISVITTIICVIIVVVVVMRAHSKRSKKLE